MDEEKLIFPINIYETVAGTSNINKEETHGLAIAVWFLASGIGGWLMAGWLRGLFPSHYLLLTLVLELIVQGTVGLNLFRLLFDEDELMAEMSGEGKSFANFFRVYRTIKAGESLYKYNFDVVEMGDGTYAVYLKYLYGANSDAKAKATYKANLEVEKLLSKYNLSSRTYTIRETFSYSRTAEEMRKSLSQISNKELFTAYRDIVTGILDDAEVESNVPMAVKVVFARTRAQMEDLKQAIARLLDSYTGTVYRQVNPMPFDEVVEFLRTYYQLDYIDMGQVRSSVGTQKVAVCSTKVVRLYADSGKTYTMPEFKDMKQKLLKEHGLKGVK